MTGIERIAAERQRQIDQEGWTAEHDVEHGLDDLAVAGVCYALPGALRDIVIGGGRLWTHLWRWAPQWWKPGPTRIRELEKAGALIAAEIDRRLAAGES